MMMESGYIKMKDVLAWVFSTENRNIPFAISFMSLDKRLNTGGELIELKNVIRPNKEVMQQINKKPLEIKSKEHMKQLNSIFNVYVAERNRFYAVHTDLIIFFQNKRVVY